jgi:hypothetical protein
MLDNQKFDTFLKEKIKQEEPIKIGENMERILEKSIHKASENNKFSWLYTKLLTATIIFILIGSTSFLFTEKANVNKNNDVNTTKSNTPIPSKKMAIDINKEKEKLEKEGYLIRSDGINLEGGTSMGGMADLAFVSTLKDHVFISDNVVNGKIRGVKYYIKDNFAYSEAKLLVVKSYDGKIRPGEIVTVVSFGGIVSQYDSIIMNGIDKKFTMSQKELEAAKSKMVVANTFIDEIIYPDDQMVVFFTNESMEPNGEVEKGYKVSGPLIKYDNEKNIIKKTEQGLEGLDDLYSEFRHFDNLKSVEDTISAAIKEKQDYAPTKAREIAYNALTTEDQKKIVNWVTANVNYHSEGRFIQGKKTKPNVIVVEFRTNEELPIIVVVSGKDYKLITIFKDGI